MSDFINDNEQVTHYDPVAEQAAKAAEQKPVQESEREQNWKKMREENDRYKREAEDLKRQLESKVGDDELVEQRHLKQMRAQIEQQTLELRLKSKFPDFDEVVNTENLQKLAKEDPELAYTLDSTQDMYAKAVAAYKMIQSKQPKEQPLSEDDEMFEENQYKPRNSNSLNPKNDTPLAGANAFQRGLTKDQKSKLWAEMQEAIKNR